MNFNVAGDAYVRCEVCREIAPMAPLAAIAQWDWFTGSLDRTHHYCPRHRASPERQAMFRKSQQRTPTTHQEGGDE